MNIGVISDLHVDINEAADGPSIEEALLEVSNENKLDALIIAGDISNDVNRSLAVLSSLKAQSGIPVLFVPGNHDYWSKVNGIKDTWQVYKQFQTYEGNLCERPFELDNGWVVIGSSVGTTTQWGTASIARSNLIKCRQWTGCGMTAIGSTGE